MMKRIMTRRSRTLRGKKAKITVIATAITTILSATAAFVAIKTIKKPNLKKGDKGEIETVLDGLVEDGIISQAQEFAIQSAITTAKEASSVNNELTRDDNGESETVLDPSKTGTLTRLKKSLLKVGSTQQKKQEQEMAI